MGKRTVKIPKTSRPQRSFTTFLKCKPKRVLQVGGNRGQETEACKLAGVEDMLILEAVPGMMRSLKKRAATCGYTAIQMLASDVDDVEVDFFCTNNKNASSSMLPLGDVHRRLYPKVKEEKTIRLKTSRLDTRLRARKVAPGYFDALVVDVQGAELHVLRGLGDYLPTFKNVWLEVSKRPLYEGGATWDGVVAFMAEAGFTPKGEIPDDREWTDILFVRGN